MNLGELREHCNYLVNKDQLGDPADPNEFGLIARFVNVSMFTDEWNRLKKIVTDNNLPMSDAIMNSSFLSYLTEIATTGISGTTTLSESSVKIYHYLSGNIYINDYDSGPDVEFVSMAEFNRMRNNALKLYHSEKVYIGVAGFNNRFTLRLLLPQDHPYKYLRYQSLRIPDAPVFDWCYDSFGNTYYMPPASQITAAGELVDSEGDTIATGVQHETASLPHTSTSVEFAYKESEVPEIIERIVEQMSIADRQLNLAQYKNAKIQSEQ